MKVCHISDTHDVHQDLSMIVPNDTELLLFTGDLTYRGADWEIDLLLKQFRKLSARVPNIVGILGNHEVGCQGKEVGLKERFKEVGVILLHNEATEVNGIKIYGSPYTPWFFGWAYQYENARFAKQYAGEYMPTAEEIWNKVPEDTQILLSHGPPQFILDTCRDGSVGCAALRRRIEVTPSIKYSMFGHIHEGYGVTEVGGVTYSNASIMTGKYKFVNKPNIFEIE